MSEAVPAADAPVDALAPGRGRRTDAVAGHGVSFGEALRVWLRVAALSFGGPPGRSP